MMAFVFRVMAETGSDSPAERRTAVMEIARTKPPDGVARLARALSDDNVLVKRSAARSLIEFGKAAEPALNEGLTNSDCEVRIISLQGLNKLGTVANNQLATALKDDNSVVRQRAVEILAGMKPYSRETEALLETAAKDKEDDVRDAASKALFPFNRQAPLLRERVDNVVTVIKAIPLPKDGWKLKPDPLVIGHKEKWFDPVCNDGDWNPAVIGTFWGDYGSNYVGIAWYRGTFALPEKPGQFDAIEIDFNAVDESGWVWLNGEYVGQHDLGTSGWDMPFQIDVTEFVKWGQTNQMTVRVLNTAFAGGIWKPVTINIMKIGK